MKLSPLAPKRLVFNIRRFSKEFGLDVITEEAVELSEIIVVGNGIPDAKAIAILAHHLDGDRIVGIVKPERNGLGVLEVIPAYLTLEIDKILILMDQDDNALNHIFNLCQEKLKIFVGEFEIEHDGDRLKIYNCIRGNKTFKTILVINGLNNILVRKHTIEDHLIKAAINLNFTNEVTEEIESSKDIWYALSKDHKNEVLKKLAESRTQTKSFFPQQVMACEYLEEL